MRLLSVALTKDQCYARQKTETRRLGWRHARPGQLLRLVEKSQGRKPGEPIVPVAVVAIESCGVEPLNRITSEAVEREGFPGRSADWFVGMFVDAMRCEPTREVTVIRWRYVDCAPSATDGEAWAAYLRDTISRGEGEP